MEYISTLTRSGQITLPKPIRDFLSIKPGAHVRFHNEGNIVTIERQKTLRETLAELDARKTPAVLKAIEKNRGKTAHQMMDEYWNSPEGEEELRKISYGN